MTPCQESAPDKLESVPARRFRPGTRRNNYWRTAWKLTAAENQNIQKILGVHFLVTLEYPLQHA